MYSLSRKKYLQEYQKKNREKIRQYNKEWIRRKRASNRTSAREENRKYYETKLKIINSSKNNKDNYYRIKNEQVRKWRQNNPLKTIAHRKVFIAKRNGTLLQKPCEKCGNPNSEAHHNDYSKPLDVIWLCKQHHADIHIELQENY